MVGSQSRGFAHAKGLPIFIIDDTTGLIAIEVCWANDEIGHIEGKETVVIETAWILLRQHKGFADTSICINVTEIRSREEAVVTTGTKDEPA